MKARLPSIIITVVVVALVVGVIAVAVTRDSGGADAITVNGQSISQATVNHELGSLISNNFAQSTTEGAIASNVAAKWLTNRVAAVAVQQLLQENDLEIDLAERKDLQQQLPARFANLPSTAQELTMVVTIGSALLSEKLGSDDARDAALIKAIRKLDVAVDPKYGRWVRAKAQVCPPTGCVAAAGSQSASGG